jgi:uncharacterized protein YraI
MNTDIRFFRMQQQDDREVSWVDLTILAMFIFALLIAPAPRQVAASTSASAPVEVSVSGLITNPGECAGIRAQLNDDEYCLKEAPLAIDQVHSWDLHLTGTRNSNVVNDNATGGNDSSTETEIVDSGKPIVQPACELVFKDGKWRCRRIPTVKPVTQPTCTLVLKNGMWRCQRENDPKPADNTNTGGTKNEDTGGTKPVDTKTDTTDQIKTDIIIIK